MRWVFCHVTIQQISSGEETWKETRKGDPLPSVTPTASYTLSTFRSEERRKKKKNRNEGMEERKLLSPAPLSVRLEQTEGTPYEQLPHYWTNQRFLRSVEVPYLIYIYVVWQDVLRSRAHESKVWNMRESTLSVLTGRNASFTTIPNCLSMDGQTERLADFWIKISIKYLI